MVIYLFVRSPEGGVKVWCGTPYEALSPFTLDEVPEAVRLKAEDLVKSPPRAHRWFRWAYTCPLSGELNLLSSGNDKTLAGCMTRVEGGTPDSLILPSADEVEQEFAKSSWATWMYSPRGRMLLFDKDGKNRPVHDKTEWPVNFVRYIEATAPRKWKAYRYRTPVDWYRSSGNLFSDVAKPPAGATDCPAISSLDITRLLAEHERTAPYWKTWVINPEGDTVAMYNHRAGKLEVVKDSLKWPLRLALEHHPGWWGVLRSLSADGDVKSVRLLSDRHLRLGALLSAGEDYPEVPNEPEVRRAFAPPLKVDEPIFFGPPPKSLYEDEPSKDNKPRGVKSPMFLLPWKALRAAAAVFLHGDHKYNGRSWAMPPKDEEEKEARLQEYISACGRHLTDITDPNASDIDGESGLHHALHAIACLLIYCYILGLDYEKPKGMDKPRGWGVAK